MRVALILLPALLAAQVPPAAKPPAAKPAAVKPKPAATPSSAKPASRATGPAKPAAAKTKPAPVAAPMTDDEKTIYALGLSVSRSLGQFELSLAEIEIVKRALTDAAAGKPAIELAEWGPKIQPFAKARMGRIAERQKVASKAYMDKAAMEPGAVKTESGIVYRELTPGSGESPKATDTVKVHYRGTLIDGTEFDSSYKRNEPAQFALNGVIKCWTEGVQKIKVGGKSQLICPSDMAYGDQGRPNIPGGAALVFEVELLGIVNPAAPSPAPPQNNQN